MLIYLKAGGKLREFLKPDVDEYTRRLELPVNMNLKDILISLGIPTGFVAFATTTDGTVKRLDYIPVDGDCLSLIPPVGGG
jgi:sulfur carrier protein ThiS